MAQYTKLAYILNGLVQNVDLAANDLALSAVRLGGASGTLLTQAILDRLVSLQDGSDIAATYHHHDGRYFTETELGAASGTTGSDLIGDDATYSNFTPAAATVKGALSGIDAALATSGSGELKVSANDTTKGYLETKIVSANSLLTISTLNDGGDEDLQLTVDNSAIDHGALAGLADDDHTQYHNDARGDARYYQKSEFVTTATAGAPVKLDGAGKIAVAQLPSAIMTYEGVWNASTNSPSLADGVGDTGMVYRVGTAGSQNLGSGSISFDVGDYVIYNGTTWEKSDTTDAVASVFGRTGIVTAQSGDYTASQVTNTPAGGIAATTVQAAINELDSEKFNSADFNSSFDTRLGTKSTTDLAEGSNLYFTDERAQDAVGGMLVDTATIDLTYTDGTPSITADVKSNSISETHLTASVAGDGLTGGNGTALAVGAGTGISVTANAVSVDYAPMVKKSMTAGESMAANTTFLVRFAVTGETAGRMYKATNAAAVADGKFYATGLALKTSAVNAGDAIDVVFAGSHALGASDTPFGAGDVGKPVYLTTAGGFSVTAPTGSGEAVWRVGMVESTTSIWVGDKQLNGIA